MAKLISLEGATVTVPSGWTAIRGYGEFFIDGVSSNNRYFSRMYIGYYFYEEDFSMEENDSICLYSSLEQFQPYESFTITIEGGSDVTNTSLIQWFLDINATIEGGIWEEETPLTKIKSPVVVIKQRVKQVIVDNANMTIDIYTKEVPKELITFTKGTDTYQAEEGMTWTEWVASSYNTDGYYISNNYVYTQGGFNVRLGTVNVLATDLIISDGTYTGTHDGGIVED